LSRPRAGRDLGPDSGRREPCGGLILPLAVGSGLLGGLCLGVVGVLLFGQEAAPRYVDLARFEAPLPAAPAPARLDPAPPPPFAEPALPPPSGAPGAPPAAADPALLEPGPFGPLPRVAADGRAPFRAYARPAAATAGPRIALLIDGLGLQEEATRAAVALAPEIGLVFSPYTDGLDAWLARARRAGHEVWLGLPLEPRRFPHEDPGPDTLRIGPAAGDNAERLARLLARGSGYVGLAGEGERFATSAAVAGLVLESVAGRGLALVELGRADLADLARATGLPYARAHGPLDREPRAAAIDGELAGLEARARAEGAVLAFLGPTPVALDRLRVWQAGLASRGVELVPPSALIHAPPVGAGAEPADAGP
jgi:uncharacterized protein